MQYFKICPGRFIRYDEVSERAMIIVKSDLIEQKQALTERIATADPDQPKTNAEWISWAKSHYPYVDHSAEQIELNRINEILDAIKSL